MAPHRRTGMAEVFRRGRQCRRCRSYMYVGTVVENLCSQSTGERCTGLSERP